MLMGRRCFSTGAALYKLRLAGVPEQVNIPIQICSQLGIFERHGLSVEYQVTPEVPRLQSSSISLAPLLVCYTCLSCLLDVLFWGGLKGTGAMLDALEARRTDLALCVTDAFITGRSKGRKTQLCGVYVESPLRWAVVVAR
jgi:hypothetical protein